jgi:3-phosphoshikimate 1-carboxyvinyltransferase
MTEFSGGVLNGRFKAPPSKSYTHRAIILASLAKGTSTIHDPLVSFDTVSTMQAMTAMGAVIEQHDNELKIIGNGIHSPAGALDVGNSGTTIRLLSGVVSSLDSHITLTGDGSIQKRPMRPLLDALTGMGVSCTSNNGSPPVTIKGPNNGGNISIPGNISSQFISSLILSAPLFKHDTVVKIEGNLVSRPYVDITIGIMGDFGVSVTEDNGFRIKTGQTYEPRCYRVPGDMSSAAFPLVGGALSGSVTMEGYDEEDPQGDKAIVNILEECGADISVNNGRITVKKKELRGCDVDMSNIPDLFPVVAVLLSTARGTSKLYGAPHLRYKESDRILSTTRMLNTLGADITPTDDGCIIKGVERLKGGNIEHLGDHRIAMSAAIASLVSRSPVAMNDTECCSVSFPGFLDVMKDMGMVISCTD